MTAAEEEEPIFEMSPFEVSAEANKGYASSNVMSAYRVNASIKEIPFNIQVVTDEFMDEQNVVNLDDALQFVAGLTPANLVQHEVDVYNIRGLTAARPKRNGYRRYYAFDMTNVQRVEVVKGPASALFGEAQPGGIINYITKRPSAERSTEIKAQYGSYDLMRLEVGTTGPFSNDSEKWLYRLDASVQDSEGFRDWTYEKRTFIAPVVSWAPNENTKVIVDFEYQLKDFNPPSANLIWNEEATRAFWLEEVGFEPDFKDFPNELTAFIADLEEQLSNDPIRSILIGLQGENFSDHPRNESGDILYNAIYPTALAPLKYSSTGPDSFFEIETINFTAEFQHTFNDTFSMRLVHTKGNTTLNAYRADTKRVRVLGDGLQQGKRYIDRENEVVTWQVDAIAQYEFLGGNHRTIVGSELLDDNFASLTLRNDSLPGRFVSQLIVLNDEAYPLFRNYDSRFGVNTNGELLVTEPLRIDRSDFFDENGDPINLDQNVATDRRMISYYVSHQVSFFRDQLKILMGIRRDELEQTFLRSDGNQGVSFFDDDGLPVTLPFSRKQSATTPQVGINWFATGSTVFYANYSESFAPTEGVKRNLDGTSEAKPPEIGEGWEIGTKLSAFDGRLSATIAYFDIAKNDVVRGALGPNNEFYEVLLEGQSSKGYEIDLFFYPTESLQIIAGFAKIDSKENLPDGQTLIDDRIPGVPEHQVTLWAKYSFLEEGLLEGLEVGLGATYLDERRGGGIGDYINLDAYTKVDAMLSYGFVQSDIEYRLSLKIDNLFDELYYRPGPFVGDPRNYNISITATF